MKLPVQIKQILALTASTMVVLVFVRIFYENTTQSRKPAKKVINYEPPRVADTIKDDWANDSTKTIGKLYWLRNIEELSR